MKLRSKLRISLTLCMLLFALLVSACKPAVENTPIAPKRDTLSLYGSDVGTFNIFETGSGVDLMYIHTICEPLVSMDNDFKFYPRLCESYEVSADGLVYTFVLRKDVTFHNGKALTSADVVYSINKALTAPLTAEFPAYIDSVEATDEHTVVVHLKSPYFVFLYNLATYHVIVPDGIFESDYDFEAKPIGTGPYEFVSYAASDKLVFKANPNYYIEGVPAIENVVYRMLTDESAKVIGFETGDVDYMAVSATSYDLIKDMPDVKTHTVGDLNAILGWMDNTIKPFNNTKVRLAINYAIDKATLAKVLGEKFFLPATQVTPPCVFGHNPDVVGYPYDTEKAKALLAEAGHPGGQGISVTISTMDAVKTIAEFIQESLRSIGIDAKIEVLERNTMVTRMIAGEIPFGVTSIGPGMYAGMNSIILASDGAFNLSHYKNDEVDELYRLASEALSDEDRLDYYRQIDEILQEDAPMIPLLWRNSMIAARDYLDLSEALKWSVGEAYVPAFRVKFAE